MCMYVHTNGTKMLLKLAKVDVYRIFVRNYFRKKTAVTQRIISISFR